MKHDPYSTLIAEIDGEKLKLLQGEFKRFTETIQAHGLWFYEAGFAALSSYCAPGRHWTPIQLMVYWDPKIPKQQSPHFVREVLTAAGFELAQEIPDWRLKLKSRQSALSAYDFLVYPREYPQDDDWMKYGTATVLGMQDIPLARSQYLAFHLLQRIAKADNNAERMHCSLDFCQLWHSGSVWKIALDNLFEDLDDGKLLAIAEPLMNSEHWPASDGPKFTWSELQEYKKRKMRETKD